MPVTSVGGVNIEYRERTTASRSGSLSRANDVLLWALLAVVALAPLPFGSNRPFFWSLTAIAVGAIGMIYFVAVRRAGDSLRMPLDRIWPQGLLFTVFCCYLVVQMLPIASLFGDTAIVRSGDVVIESHTISLSPGNTFLMLLRMGTYGVFFFLMLQTAVNESRARFALDAMLGFIAIYALVGLFSLQAGDTILGLPKWSYPGSATGTFVNRNSFATFLAFGGTIAATQMVDLIVKRLQDPSRETRLGIRVVAYGAIYVLLVSTVVATQSRMGLFVTLAGTVSPLLLGIGRTTRSWRIVAVLLLVGGAALGVILTLYGGGLFERLGGVDQSAGVRFRLYDQVIDLVLSHLWTGTGGGTFDLAFPLVHQLPVNPDLVWDRAHNTYLALWSDTGIIFGSLPVLAFLLAGGRLAWRLVTGRGSWRMQAVALSVMIVGGLHSLVDFSLEIQANTIMFLAIIAVGSAAGLATDSKRSS